MKKKRKWKRTGKKSPDVQANDDRLEKGLGKYLYIFYTFL